MKIKFGTDGWRAIIAKEYTYDNLKKVSIATGKYFLKHPQASNGICIGYDTRFMSAEFAQYSAEILSGMGLKVYLGKHFSPTPAISLFVKDKTLAGGVVITASHNPPLYNGFKVKGDYGGPAHPETIAEIESIMEGVDGNEDITPNPALIIKTDITTHYLNDIKKKINIKLIKSQKIKIGHHAMFGAGQGLVTKLLGDNVIEYNSEFNPSFKGINPEPIPKYIGDYLPFHKKNKLSVSIINDGDADRIGMLDEKGEFVDAHKIFALILEYLIEKGMTGEVAKTFTLTNLIDKICEHRKVKMHLLPVGFKYVGRLMTTNDILIGGEESGGLAIKTHIPERDGIFIGLLIVEIMAKKKKKLSQLIEGLYKQYGKLYFDRKDAHLTEEEKSNILTKCTKGKLSTIGDMKVISHSDLDGDKYFFDGGWVLIRASGTEPIIRIYSEANNKAKVKKAIDYIYGLR